jgi:hypothetical protein
VVPTGTPVQGDYSGELRPQVHFSPPAVSICVSGVDLELTSGVYE